LEETTFGQSHPTVPIADRLTHLEMTIFQRTYPSLTLDQRTQQLADTLFGSRANPDFHGPTPQFHDPTTGVQPLPAPTSPSAYTEPPLPEFGQPDQPELGSGQPKEEPDDSLWFSPQYQAEIPREEIDRFILEQVNMQRAQRGLNPLKWESLAGEMSKKHVEELARRSTVSHLNEAGDNPDLRYTRAGGEDAVIEGLVVLPGDAAKVPNRAMVMKILKTLNSHQDDRDALLSPDATDFAFSYDWTQGHAKLISCCEIVTKHGVMHPIPREVQVGEKIDIKGVILPPYEFSRITVAWEGLNKGASSFEENEEAMPYFPPLDYVAHATKAEHGDHDKAITALKTLGIIAAIAGGMIIPPVALAAPLIAMAGPNVGEPHAVSEIPVKGGIKIEGNTFTGSVPISNDGKEGQYYVTVWATSPHNGHPVPISRRIIIANAPQKDKNVEQLSDSPQAQESQPEPAKAKKHKKDNKHVSHENQ
jgi:uncharacterized protein YkwD